MIKSLILRYTIFLFVLSIICPVTSHAQLDEPSFVPWGLSADKRTELKGRRAVLIDQLNDLDANVKAHDIKCARVPGSNKALMEECLNTSLKLRSQGASFSTRVKAFGIAIGRAVKETDPSPDDLAHDLSVKAIEAGMKGDEKAAIGYYREALKYRPNDRGIQISLGHALHARDKGKGIKASLKTEYILDALQSGDGDWEASITYLEDALSEETDNAKSVAQRAALNYIKEIYAQQ